MRLALDDFGAEYSSLSRLATLPFPMVKIDRSFLDGAPEDPKVVAFLRAVVDLGRALELTVTVEGVETSAQLDLLDALDVPLAQGYLLGRPQPHEGTTALLTDCLATYELT